MTLNIFLNKECEGGTTSFFQRSGKKNIKVVSISPSPGVGTLFDRRILHCGDRVKSGVKYLFRTDVMY